MLHVPRNQGCPMILEKTDEASMSYAGSLKTLLRHVTVLSSGQSSGWIVTVTMGGLRPHLEQQHSTEADPQSVYERVHPAPSIPLRSGSVSEANDSTEFGDHSTQQTEVL